jgi:uncharacterized protein YllA (UPF0747 family)
MLELLYDRITGKNTDDPKAGNQLANVLASYGYRLAFTCKAEDNAGKRLHPGDALILGTHHAGYVSGKDAQGEGLMDHFAKREPSWVKRN